MVIFNAAKILSDIFDSFEDLFNMLSSWGPTLIWLDNTKKFKGLSVGHPNGNCNVDSQ